MHMLTQWEEFKVGPGNVEDELHVSLCSRGRITIGSRALKKFGNHEYVVLLFDRVNSLIGIGPSSRHTKHAYPMKLEAKSKRYSNHRIILASRFCRHYGITTPQQRIAFVGARVNEDGILVLDLKKTRVLSRPRKQPAG
jgi:hypothetical protein